MIVSAVRKMLFGNVVFIASGGFPGLFLEECAVRRAVLEDVEQGPAFVRACVRERDHRPVCEAAEKAGMTLSVEAHTGLPYLLFRYRSRVGVPVGLLLAALIIWYLSGALWQITVTGNERLSDLEILDAMEEIGVCRGARIRDVNVKDAEEQAQNLLPTLSWIALNIKGCKAEVEVREIIAGEEPHTQGTFANIVAARDGVIVRADVFAGDGQPKVGEPVVKGDLLVSGVIEMNNGFYRLTEARAIIEALTVTDLTVSADRRFTADRLVKMQSIWGIRFFGLRIPFGFAIRNGEREMSESDVQSRTTVFPIGCTYDRISVFESSEITPDLQMTQLICFADFCQQAYQRYRDAAVTDVVVTFSSEKNRCTTAARYRCIENIALRVPFEVLRDAAEPEEQ